MKKSTAVFILNLTRCSFSPSFLLHTMQRCTSLAEAAQWKAEEATAAPYSLEAFVFRRNITKWRSPCDCSYQPRWSRGKQWKVLWMGSGLRAQTCNYTFWMQPPRGTHIQVPVLILVPHHRQPATQHISPLMRSSVFPMLSFCLAAVITKLMQSNYKDRTSSSCSLLSSE